ncbi:hypothetical protein H696_04836 [Fonticula alba]|uniref:DNA-directed RNA polymerase RBP11-like dimerisation domain-containing protein n=1 Tax=Fonticula alba TaxID=691883 RepID=A0A058Z2P5_FONAL|nr:hypothetical protein H696_04836 [Fonticula alba]KCV68544.1 hypothetical protein H696_04836 [Fonticula alba]|eukprot:XP_009496976.1 hypothetical protein H696_04836 [Fonticula alba]
MRGINAPDPNSLVYNEDNTPKVTFHVEPTVPNAGTFELDREDHTLGNLIRMYALKDERVLFCGYKVPHPLEHTVQIKIQSVPPTASASEIGMYSVGGPRAAFIRAVASARRDVMALESSFEKSLNDYYTSHHTQQN